MTEDNLKIKVFQLLLLSVVTLSRMVCLGEEGVVSFGVADRGIHQREQALLPDQVPANYISHHALFRWPDAILSSFDHPIEKDTILDQSTRLEHRFRQPYELALAEIIWNLRNLRRQPISKDLVCAVRQPSIACRLSMLSSIFLTTWWVLGAAKVPSTAERPS